MDRTAANTPRDALIRACDQELAALEAAGLRRRTEVRVGPTLVDFVSNDYLDLAADTAVRAGARSAVEQAGSGARAARLLGGGAALQQALEAKLAEWQGTSSALLFPSGYQANLGVLTAFAGRGDAILSDELNHASIVDGCRLSRARVEVYRHCDPSALEHALVRTRSARRRIVVTESVFSMDGDLAPLPEIHALCVEHDAVLLIDDAHAVGLLGDECAGAWRGGARDERALLGRIITGGKALGASGGIFLGERSLREILLHRARSFIFSTALPPAVIGALSTAIDRIRSDPARAASCLANAKRLAANLGLAEPAAAIVPIVLGDAQAALDAQRVCEAAGFDVRAVRPPTVPKGSSRLRVVAHAGNTFDQVDRLSEVLRPSVSRLRTVDSSASTSALARSVFICGTDTGIGKTLVSALVFRALREAEPVRYWKPVQTGDDSDTATVSRLTECGRNDRFEPEYEFPLPASPHTAAAHAQAVIDERRIDVAHAEHLGALSSRASLVIEFAGGLLVPYRIGFDQGDWLARLARSNDRIVLVARSGLGTLNHTQLTLEALARRALEPALLVLVGELHAANCATLRELAPHLPIVEVPQFAEVSPDTLREWLGDRDCESSPAARIRGALA